MAAPKLLLVEDDPRWRNCSNTAFQAEGYQVRTTSDGDEALILADEDAPDLVILDWMIEGTSGIEVPAAGCAVTRRPRMFRSSC